MKKILLIALIVFLVGNIIDLLTTFYGISIGLVEQHTFSLVLKISLMPIMALIFFIYKFPQYKIWGMTSLLLSYGLVFLFVGLNNLMLIGG